jgi:predicted methyltransferase
MKEFRVMDRRLSVLCVVMFGWCVLPAIAQDQSVRPGINDRFQNANVKEWLKSFETESREVYAQRQQIVAACKLHRGETIADIGAGTGLFTRLFAREVGEHGRVIAVDITQNFLNHILATSRAAGLQNVETLLCTQESTELPADSIDVAFICDTYHHFEFPQKTLASIFQALKPGGRLILIDFHRIEGKTSDWILSHVRAGKEVFVAEIEKAGFQKIGERTDLMKDNYFIVFQRPSGARQK